MQKRLFCWECCFCMDSYIIFLGTENVWYLLRFSYKFCGKARGSRTVVGFLTKGIWHPLPENSTLFCDPQLTNVTWQHLILCGDGSSPYPAVCLTACLILWNHIFCGDTAELFKPGLGFCFFLCSVLAYIQVHQLGQMLLAWLQTPSSSGLDPKRIQWLTPLSTFHVWLFT